MKIEDVKVMMGHLAIKDEDDTAKMLAVLTMELIESNEAYVHDPMSVKEIKTSWGTINCEMQELLREIDRVDQKPEDLFIESLQTAAMGLKFLIQVAYPLLEKHQNKGKGIITPAPLRGFGTLSGTTECLECGRLVTHSPLSKEDRCETVGCPQFGECVPR